MKQVLTGKRLMFLRAVVLVAALLLPMQAMAATTYKQYIVVAGSGGNYTTLPLAIASITDASATKRYLIKVMPGEYNHAATPIQMKSFVDVEGTGDDSVLIGSTSNVDADTCTKATVLMANNSSIKNIKIVNNSPALNGAYVNVSALVFNNVVASAEGVTVLTGSLAIDGGRNEGISVCGSSAQADIKNATVYAYNKGVRADPIRLLGNASINLTHSRLIGAANAFPNGDADVIGISTDFTEGSPLGKINVSYTTIDLTTPGMAHGMYLPGYETTISYCTFNLNKDDTNGISTEGFSVGSPFTMVNSTINSARPVQYYDGGTPDFIKIANSRLPGDVANGIGLGAKLVNNFDENFNAIANR